jgi:hypothetical protein
VANSIRHILLILALASTASACGVADSGDEITIANNYGTTTSHDVGARFTDGVSLVEINKGPIELISVDPVLKSSNVVHYLGASVRLLGRPDWTPATTTDGYPPSSSTMAGSVPVKGFRISGPTPGQEKTFIEVMFGFEVTAEGRAARRGAELLYKYKGKTHKAFIPSYLAVCAPKMQAGKCADEDADKGS